MKKYFSVLALFILFTAFSFPKADKGKPVEITDSNFQHLVLQSNDVVLVDFWAVWCGPCRRMNPILNKLAIAYKDEAVIGKLNVDHSKLVPRKYNIKNLPTILIFKKGKLVDKVIGLNSYKALETKLKRHL